MKLRMTYKWISVRDPSTRTWSLKNTKQKGPWFNDRDRGLSDTYILAALKEYAYKAGHMTQNNIALFTRGNRVLLILQYDTSTKDWYEAGTEPITSSEITEEYIRQELKRWREYKEVK